MRIAISAFAVAALVPCTPSAQLLTEGPVTNGHYHVSASDVAAHERFWGDTLGGEADTYLNDIRIFKFPDALVFLLESSPDGPSMGSSVDHIGFAVPDLRAMVDRITAAGYEMITEAVSPPGAQVVEHIRVMGGDGPVSGIAFVLGPDEVKIELLERRGQQRSIVSDHVHFFGPDNEQMRAWYAEHFGAEIRQGPQRGFVAGDLPALALNFTTTDADIAGTQGRALHHIGFEIDGLEAFAADLKAKGIEFDVPYSELPDADLAYALLTDPWGTFIELTEGLDMID